MRWFKDFVKELRDGVTPSHYAERYNVTNRTFYRRAAYLKQAGFDISKCGDRFMITNIPNYLKQTEE